jgi:chitin synthase
MKDPNVRQAWREKMGLCVIIAVLCAAVGFATVGFQKALCPANASSNARFLDVGATPGTVGIYGAMFNVSSARSINNVDLLRLSQSPGLDVTNYFQRDASQFKSCQGLKFRVALDAPCPSASDCALPPMNTSTFRSLSISDTGFLAGYSWNQVSSLHNFFVLDGAVLNMVPYFTLHPKQVPNDSVDRALRTVMQQQLAGAGKDGTRLFFNRADLESAVPCLKERYYAGNIDKVTPGCFATSLFLYTGLIVILGLVFVRFVMACVFNWFMSARLAGAPTSQDLNRSAISPAVMPGGANISVDSKNGTAPWANDISKRLQRAPKSIASSSSATLTNSDSSTPIMSLAQIGAELFAVCLVTCYSEGEESLRTTLDSISSTTYSDARKLLFVVADGMITGAGEKRSTPDICVSLLEADPRFGNPISMSYNAVGSGAKSQNRAMVYAGHYSESCHFSYRVHSLNFFKPLLVVVPQWSSLLSAVLKVKLLLTRSPETVANATVNLSL